LHLLQFYRTRKKGLSERPLARKVCREVRGAVRRMRRRILPVMVCLEEFRGFAICVPLRMACLKPNF